MGRYICCEGEQVYKYNFGYQPSELCELDLQYGVGCHNMDEGSPEYTMTVPDIAKLKGLLEETISLPNGKETTRLKMISNFRRAERRLFKTGAQAFNTCDKFYKVRARKNYGAEFMFWRMALMIYRQARKEYRKGKTKIFFTDEF